MAVWDERGIERARVEAALREFRSARESLPNTSEYTRAVSNIESILSLLKVCWNTAGGEKEQARLQGICDSDLSFLTNIVSNRIADLKGKDITVGTSSHTDVIYNN